MDIPNLHIPSTSQASNSSQHHSPLQSQHSNIPDNHFLEELRTKIDYFNKRAKNYYFLIELDGPQNDENGNIQEEEVKSQYINPNEDPSDDSGLESLVTSMEFESNDQTA